MSWKLHLQFIKMEFAGRLAYRIDFTVSVIAMLLTQFVSPTICRIIYFAGGEFPGWTLAQVFLLQGILSTIKGFSSMSFLGIIYGTIIRVQRGEFEMLMLRPVNTLRMLVMDSFDEEDVGMFIGGLVLIGFALSRLGTLNGSILFFIPLFFLGLMFYFSLALIGSALAIKYVNVWRYYELMDLVSVFASYPKTVYSKTLGFIFTAIAPLLIVSYYPALALLGFSIQGVWLAFIGVFAWFMITLWIWHRTLKKYTGAGG